MTAEPVLTFRLALPLAEAEAAVRQALLQQGFGILTEVDVQATLRQKLGIETRPYRILGACNPGLAHASLEAEPGVGAFLPCGVALREGASSDETVIALQNPELMAEAFAAPALAPLGAQAREKLVAALRAVAQPALAS